MSDTGFSDARISFLVSLIVLVGLAATAQAETIAEWNFASDTDLLVDSSGNGNTLETSGATWSSDAPTGSGLGGSVEFDGASTMQTVGAMDLSGYTSVTITWYQKFTGTSSGIVFEYGNIDTTNGAFNSTVNNNNKPGQGQVVLNCPTSFSLDRYTNLYGSSNDTWEEMVTVIDLLQANPNDVIKLWRNGTPVGANILANAAPATFGADEKFYIGYQAIEGNYRYYSGKISGLKVEGTLVPEPGAVALLAGGLLGVLLYARRRVNK